MLWMLLGSTCALVCDVQTCGPCVGAKRHFRRKYITVPISMSTPIRRTGRGGSGGSATSLVLLLSVAMCSFFSGTLFTMYSGIDQCQGNSQLHPVEQQAQVERAVQQRLRELKAALPNCQPDDSANNPLHQEKQQQAPANDGTGPLEFPSTMSNYAHALARVSKLDLVEQIDAGVPLDLPKPGDSDVLLLYQRQQALPTHYGEYSESIPAIGAKEALEHCDFVNIAMVDHSKTRNQCIAIMPQYESHHLQKFMRIPAHGKLDSSVPLRQVSRGLQPNGQAQFAPPTSKRIQQNWELLSKYFASYQESLKELKPLVEKVATDKKTVTVMVSNFGQSELLVNFVCAARSRNLDTSSILVFATDVDTKNLAESLGLTAFYDERNFGEMPQEAARAYGDRKFTAMMMAKVICVQMVSALQYNILFQDVDIVWYKNPVEYFETNHLGFDMLFQDDGGHSIRYAPYSANSGFYFVRYNERTEYFFSSLLLAGDLILQTDSHQQALISLLSEHVSLYGLTVKVFSRDGEEFPGGYQYHQKSGNYMRAFLEGKVDPYIFHMSWTLNKDNKLLYFQQMGDWFVQEPCVHKKVGEISGVTEGDSSSFVSTCCSVEPLISCHYRDKPSKIPCKDSPPIDKGKPSFWK